MDWGVRGEGEEGAGRLQPSTRALCPRPRASPSFISTSTKDMSRSPSPASDVPPPAPHDENDDNDGTPSTGSVAEPSQDAVEQSREDSAAPSLNADADDAFVAPGHSPFETFTGDPDQELSEVGRVRSDFINDHRYAPY